MVSISIVGVAGVFIALGLAGYLLMSTGSGLSGFGQSIGVQPAVLAGNTLSSWGAGIIVVLAVLAIIVVLAFVRSVL